MKGLDRSSNCQAFFYLRGWGQTLISDYRVLLESGEDVMISGFGKFQVKTKKEHRGRNPATNKDPILSPRKVVTFKCSGKLRDRINK
jgi:integration host factor subunit alpha